MNKEIKFKYVLANPFPCYNCKNLITAFMEAHLAIYNYKAQSWKKITVSECFNCGALFGIINFPKTEV